MTTTGRRLHLRPRVDEAAARAAFAAWTRRDEAPDDLARNAAVVGLSSTWRPWWWFSVSGVGRWTGRAGVFNARYDADTVPNEHDYDWTPRDVVAAFDLRWEVVPGWRGGPDVPWPSAHDLEPLAEGPGREAPDAVITASDAWNAVLGRCRTRVRQLATAEVSGDRVIEDGVTIEAIGGTGVRFDAPVWEGRFVYRGAVYPFCVDGLSGHVRAETPRAPHDIARAVGAALVLAGAASACGGAPPWAAAAAIVAGVAIVADRRRRSRALRQPQEATPPVFPEPRP